MFIIKCLAFFLEPRFGESIYLASRSTAVSLLRLCKCERGQFFISRPQGTSQQGSLGFRHHTLLSHFQEVFHASHLSALGNGNWRERLVSGKWLFQNCLPWESPGMESGSYSIRVLPLNPSNPPRDLVLFSYHLAKVRSTLTHLVCFSNFMLQRERVGLSSQGPDVLMQMCSDLYP